MRTFGRFGNAIAWFATSVSRTPVRSAALNRISLTGRGHASASTQIGIYCAGAGADFGSSNSPCAWNRAALNPVPLSLPLIS